MAKIKKIKCAYCGNNPVPHFIYWHNESLNVLLTPLRKIILYNPFSRWLKLKGVWQKFIFFALHTALNFKIIRLQTNIEKCKVRRAQVLWQEAKERNIEFCELLLFGFGFDCYWAKNKNGQELIFAGLPRPTKYFNPKLDILDDKKYFKSLMQKNNLPTPAGGAAWNFWQAKKIFQEITKPAIVKPRIGSRGRHSGTFVWEIKQLKHAFKIAKKLCFWTVVEEQLHGPVYRATVINFKCQGVLKGESPFVVGDGLNNIEQLVEIKNKAPHPGVLNILINWQTENFLQQQNYNLNFIPQKNQKIFLSEKIGVSYGGSSAEEFNICHPENILLFERAAKVLGDPILGFDFIIEDITKPWQEQPCGFIEVNTLPFINLHHDPLLGSPRNIAAAVWDMHGW